ncbi:transaldolase/Fructose-6-phosphate aldolase domain-containing protein [Ditylenchus destructor]|nr:transaldolase/Fructose-6-phosphate aldolase domain-containing protein [Ditylenchus destructor]
MAASFRNTEEIKGLVGCDLLTISPALLGELAKDQEKVLPVLTKENAQKVQLTEVNVNEKVFRFEMNEDPMATEKLAEGIRKFAADARTLEKLVDALL